MSDRQELADSPDERAAFDCIADLLEDAGFPWGDRVRDRMAIKQAFVEAHRRGFRIRIDKVPAGG